MVELQHLQGEKAFLVNGVENVGNLNIVSDKLHFKVLRTEDKKSFRVNYYPNYDDHDVDVTYEGNHVVGSPFSLVPRMPLCNHYPDEHRFVLDNVANYDLLKINSNALEYTVFKENNERYSFNYDPASNKESQTVEVSYNNKPVENGVFQTIPGATGEKEPAEVDTAPKAIDEKSPGVKEDGSKITAEKPTAAENIPQHSGNNSEADSGNTRDTTSTLDGPKIVKEADHENNDSHTDKTPQVKVSHEHTPQVSDVSKDKAVPEASTPQNTQGELVKSQNLPSEKHFLMSGQPQQQSQNYNEPNKVDNLLNKNLGEMVKVGNMFQQSNGQWFSYYV